MEAGDTNRKGRYPALSLLSIGLDVAVEVSELLNKISSSFLLQIQVFFALVDISFVQH